VERDAAAQVGDVVTDLDPRKGAAVPGEDRAMDAAAAGPGVVAGDDPARDDAGIVVEIHPAPVPDGGVADDDVVVKLALNVRDPEAAAAVGGLVPLDPVPLEDHVALEHADAAAVVAAAVLRHDVLDDGGGRD